MSPENRAVHQGLALASHNNKRQPLTTFQARTLQLILFRHQFCSNFFLNPRHQTQCYKKFYVRNLQMFIISQSVSHFQTFLAQSNVCNKGYSLPEQSSPKMLLSKVKQWAYPQTLDQAGKACQCLSGYQLVIDNNKRQPLTTFQARTLQLILFRHQFC